MKAIVKSERIINFARGRDKKPRKRRSDRGRKRSKRTFIGQSVRDGAKLGALIGGGTIALNAIRKSPRAIGIVKNAPKAAPGMNKNLARVITGGAIGAVGVKNAGKTLAREVGTTAALGGAIGAGIYALNDKRGRRELDSYVRRADQERLDRKRRKRS